MLVFLLVLLLCATAGADYTDTAALNSAETAALNQLSAMEVVNGYPDGSFRPAATVTRAEFAKMVCIFAGQTELTTAAVPFSDVSPGIWYYGWVSRAAEQGLVNGYPEDGTYRPHNTITQQEIAAVLVRLSGVDTGNFSWPDDYIDNASKAGLFKDFTFAGAAQASRILTCQMLYNALPPAEAASEEPAEPAEDLTANTIKATITMEDGGKIVLELYPDVAPQSVRNFVYLARQGFYDGLKFHRIMKGFMIQGGDPEGIGIGGPGYSIKGEFLANGFTNTLKHERGVLSMARSNAFDSAGSQFFIMHAASPSLDGSYAAFGRVISGMDVVDRIADTPNSGGNGAVAEENKPVMKSVKIDDDTDLPLPEMIK